MLKRQTIWIVSVLMMLVVAGWLLMQSTRYRQFTHDLTHNQGIRIGTPMNEVQYILGSPTEVLEPPSPDDPSLPPKGFLRTYEVNASSGPTALPEGRTPLQFNTWVWDENGHYIWIDFDPKTHNTSVIECYVNSPRNKVVDCSTIGGVLVGDTEAEMVDLIGRPDRSAFDGSSATKTVYYGDLGLEILLRA